MKKYINLFLLTMSLGLVSCLDQVEDTGFTALNPELSFVEKNVDVTYEAVKVELKLESNLPWMATTDATWFTVSPSRGVGSATLTLSIARNRTVEQRKDILTVEITKDNFCNIEVIQGPIASGATTNYYVKVDGTIENSGLSWTNATTLSKAMENASKGDTIFVAAGTYSPETIITNGSEDNESHKTFEIHSNFALIGGYPKDASDDNTTSEDYNPNENLTVLDGALQSGKQAYHVVTVTAPQANNEKATLKGFTITNGISGNVPDEVVVVNGTALETGFAGGIMIAPSTVDITDCIITNNEGGLHAGGIFSKPRAIINMDNCVISNNISNGNGGGFWNSGSTLYMNNTSIIDNIAAFQAAGYYSINAEGFATVSRIYNSTISGNDATTVNIGRSGGGAYIREFSDAVFVNCTFSQNKAAYGGGISSYGGNNKTSKLSIINCTFIDNKADLIGGGIILWNNYSEVKIYNSIVSNNLVGDKPSDITYNESLVKDPSLISYKYSINGSNLTDDTGNNVNSWIFDAKSMLTQFANWGGCTKTYKLISEKSNPACEQGMSVSQLQSLGSAYNPAIESKVFETDQRGVSRGDSKFMGSCSTINK